MSFLMALVGVHMLGSKAPLGIQSIDEIRLETSRYITEAWGRKLENDWGYNPRLL